jgi:hypothetical protein
MQLSEYRNLVKIAMSIKSPINPYKLPAIGRKTINSYAGKLKRGTLGHRPMKAPTIKPVTAI